MSSAHAFVSEFDAVGVANETVQDGAGIGRIADVKSDGERFGSESAVSERSNCNKSCGAEVLRTRPQGRAFHSVGKAFRQPMHVIGEGGLSRSG
jgi:hypothetical protein